MRLCRNVLTCAEMSKQNTRETSPIKEPQASHIPHKSAQRKTTPRGKSATPVPLQPRGGVGKNTANYWLSRVYRPTNGRGVASAHYMMRLKIRGRRLALSLGTGNQNAAAACAAAFYNDVLALGIEAALAKHKPEAKGEEVATIGEYLTAARAVMDVRPATFAAYSVHLRRIAGDILRQRYARKAKVSHKKATRKTIEAAPLSIFTPEAVQAWRLAFVARAGDDGRKARSARISANSILRQARSLFAPRVVKFLKTLRLPDPLPLAGIEMFPRESMRYVSKIDAAILMRKAREELAEAAPDAFLAVLLAFAAGLRRGEIDRLLWRHVDFDRGQIFIEESEHGALKSEDSRGAVDIDQTTLEVLRGFRARAKGQFVLNAPQDARDAKSTTKTASKAASRPWGLRYRCTAVFERANYWLRANGIEGAKGLHTLRKEAGAVIASRDGIFAASQFLRHADIAVTAAHYADKKTRTTVDMGAIFNPKAETPANVTPMVVKAAPKAPTRRKARA